MIPDAAPGSTRPLFDEVALWMTVPSSPQAMITEACALIVNGVAPPSVVDLAGRSPGESAWAIGEVVTALLDELDLPPITPGSERAQVPATQAMCRRFVSGSLPARDLAGWAHRYIGHDGAPSLQGLVIVDDEYDVSDVTMTSEAEFGVRVAQEAAVILSL